MGAAVGDFLVHMAHGKDGFTVFFFRFWKRQKQAVFPVFGGQLSLYLVDPWAHGGARAPSPLPTPTPPLLCCHGGGTGTTHPPGICLCLADGLPGGDCPTDPLSHSQARPIRPSWLVVASPLLQPPLPPGRQADMCSVGGPEA